MHDLIKIRYRSPEIISGNGYAPEWEAEAKRRGLPILPSMVDAIPALTTEKSIKLFENLQGFTRQSWNPVQRSYEIYAKAINIEPTDDRYCYQTDHPGSDQTSADSINSVKAAGKASISVQADLLKKTSKLLKTTNSAMNKLGKLVSQVESYPEGRERAVFFRKHRYGRITEAG